MKSTTASNYQLLSKRSINNLALYARLANELGSEWELKRVGKNLEVVRDLGEHKIEIINAWRKGFVDIVLIDKCGRADESFHRVVMKGWRLPVDEVKAVCDDIEMFHDFYPAMLGV